MYRPCLTDCVFLQAKLSNLAQQHPLTEHMALPIHGCDDCVKWAANVWIHLYDFKAAHLLGKGG